MKKTRLFTGILAASAAALTLTACGASTSEYEGTGTASAAVAARDYNGFLKHTADVYKDYVSLGDYKNVEIEKVDRSNEDITDEAVDTAVKALETEYTEQTDVTEGGTTQDGDIITLDYTGTVDGVAFDGGTAADASYTIGSGNFIEDLDKGLAGKNANTEYEIPVKFPDDYHSDELKGKDAVFTVTITNITRPTVPTIDDAWVSAHSSELEAEGYGAVKTLAALKEGIKTSQHDSAVESNNSKVLSAYLTALKDTVEFKGYPEDEVSEIESNIQGNMENEFSQYQQYMSLMNQSVEVETEEGSEGAETTEATTTTVDEEQQWLDYLQQYYGLTSQEEYENYTRDYAQDYVGNKMLVTLIAADQGMTASVDEIVARGEILADAYGFDKYQDIVDQYGAAINCDTGYQVIYAKVADFISGIVKQVEPETTESSETLETSESSEVLEITDTSEGSEESEEETTSSAG